jgi:hypothetical protein
MGRPGGVAPNYAVSGDVPLPRRLQGDASEEPSMLKAIALVLSLALAACSGDASSCGGQGDKCCEKSPTCDTGLVCTGGMCQPPPACGAEGQPCCTDNVCNQGLFCDTQTHKCQI